VYDFTYLGCRVWKLHFSRLIRFVIISLSMWGCGGDDVPVAPVPLVTQLPGPSPPRIVSRPSFVTSWGSPGSGDGQFNLPSDLVASRSGSVFVCDSGNKRIQKFDRDGNFLSKWGKEISSYQILNHPYGIALDSAGNIFVADTGANLIRKFNPELQQVYSWGGPGATPGLFQNPVALAFDSMDNLYVSDMDNHRIQKFASDGSFALSWGATDELASARGIAVDNSGPAIYVADSGFHWIRKYDPLGVLLATWTTFGPNATPFRKPVGIGVDGEGNVYVGDTELNKVIVLDSSGAFLRSWGTYGWSAGEFFLMRSLFVTPDGFVYTLDGQNPPSIQMYSNQGQFLRSFADFGYWAPGYFREEEGIYVDSAGTMYIADTNNNRLQIFDSRWNFVGMIQTIDLENGAFISPSGVAESPDGDIYVIDRDLFRVQAFDESGQFKRQFGNPGIDFYFRNPACIAISPQGSIVIGDRLYLYIFPNASSEPWYSSIRYGWEVLLPILLRGRHGVSFGRSLVCELHNAG